MYETICQKCGASNRVDAVVCLRCGTKLAHPERSAGARLRASGLPQMFLMAPVRFAVWAGKKIKTLLVTLTLLLVVGGLLMFFLLFVPFSWPDYPMPQPVSEEDNAVRSNMAVLLGRGGTIRGTSGDLRVLGNLLIFDPGYGKKKIFRNKEETAAGGPDRSKGYFSAIKEGDNHFIFVLYMKWRDKLPLRLALEFEAERDKEGILELQSCKVGNLFVPRSLFRKAAEKMLAEWNPKQQLLAAFDRLEKGSMELRSNTREETLILTVRPAEPQSSGSRR